MKRSNNGHASMQVRRMVDVSCLLLMRHEDGALQQQNARLTGFEIQISSKAIDTLNPGNRVKEYTIVYNNMVSSSHREPM